MTLETIYLELKIITLTIFLISGVGIGLSILWQMYVNYKESEKTEAERIKKESNPEFIKEEKLKNERLGVSSIPKGFYKQRIDCRNCNTSLSEFFIKKGILVEDFRKYNFCYTCGNRLDYKK